MVRPIVAPTVPVGSERVRICLHAGNNMEQIDGLAKAVEEWLVAQMTLEKDGSKVLSQSSSDKEQTDLWKPRL